jgi:hypothetical protein
MKRLILIPLLLFALAVYSQRPVPDYQIDGRAAGLESSALQSLAVTLTAPYHSSYEKCRAIYAWVAQHISYAKGNRLASSNSFTETLPDSILNRQSLDEWVAGIVFRKRYAVCEGYARLFKFLCEANNIPCQLIHGYARSGMNRANSYFHSNHTWNAVWVDSNWHLVDVTWGSGYFLYAGNDFIRAFDDHYFFTPPASFANDHFPDDLRWTLTSDPPLLREFVNSPFRTSSFVKYDISALQPMGGIVHANVGDTLHFQLAMGDLKKKVNGGSLDDTLGLGIAIHPVYCKPASMQGNTVHYECIVSQPMQWISLVFNDDVVLNYHVVVRK